MGDSTNSMQRVLMYHALESEGHPAECVDAGHLLYVLEVETFLKHLEMLKAENYNQLFLDSSANSSNGPVPSAIISFDDGHITNYTLAYPLLMKHALKAHFFITTDWINNDYFMTDSMIKELSSAGMTIGSHGVSHDSFTTMTDPVISMELNDSRRYLEDLIGKQVKNFAPPGGWIDERILSVAVDAGYENVYVSDPSPSLCCDGLKIIGRLAVKRNYDLTRFAKMLVSGRSPESVFIAKGVKIAKKLMGSETYNSFREVALGLVRSR